MSGLRTLLPDRLVNPTRAILQPPSRSAPEKLAAQLKEAAVNGSRDIQQFKKDYHSDQMRELFQKVNAAEIPQEQDAWSTDYVALVQKLESNDGKASGQILDAKIAKPDETISDADAVQSFRTQHPDVAMNVSDESVGLPIEMQLPSMKFRINKGQLDTNRKYDVTVEDKSMLGREVQQYLETHHIDSPLSDLLVRLESVVILTAVMMFRVFWLHTPI